MYWIEEYGDCLDPEEIKELLEAVLLDEMEWDELNKRKHFNIDDKVTLGELE